jgi:hypothetical protein
MVVLLAEKIATVSGNFQSLVVLVNDQPSLRALARDNESKVEFLKGFTDDLLALLMTCCRSSPRLTRRRTRRWLAPSRGFRATFVRGRISFTLVVVERIRQVRVLWAVKPCHRILRGRHCRSFLASIAKSPSKRRREESSIPEGRGKRVRRVDSAISVASSLSGSHLDKFQQLDDLTSELTDEEEE